MSSSPDSDILAKIARNQETDAGGDNPWDSLAATEPCYETEPREPSGDDAKLSELLQRVDRLAASGPTAAYDKTARGAAALDDSAESPSRNAAESFMPAEPTSLREAGLSPSEIESLVLKLLLARGDVVGRATAEQIHLPFVLVEEVLLQMKRDQLVVYRASAAMNDYVYQLTDLGRERARGLAQHCTYFGAAPVPLAKYVESVRQQSLEGQCPTEEELERAFGDLLINRRMLARLGPAINSGRGLFLFGPPGNGKTSIAERVTAAFGQHIWVPRAVSVDGEIMRLYDPMNHVEVPLEERQGLLQSNRVDKRWVRIRRPTIVVGGELTMDNLEVTPNAMTGVSEAPVQLKSNCGTLVIDDFGRQRMSTDELLNRWIVPLEKRYDFLSLAHGKKIQVPFDQLVIFSTNLEPRDLVDDAFLRRIPYKIEVTDPSESEFRDLFRMMCDQMEIEYDDDAVTYLLETHYRALQRPLRCCQPRDLLLQVRNRCRYERTEMALTTQALDFAVENYFAVM